MYRLSVSLVAGLVIATALGCAMCCGPYDYTYPTYGGRYERVNPEWGRVGSILSDPAAPGYISNPAQESSETPLLEDDLDDAEELELPDPKEEETPSNSTERPSTRRRVQRNNRHWR